MSCLIMSASQEQPGAGSARGDIYAFDDATLPAPPPLPGVVNLARTSDEMLDRVAGDMVAQAEACVREFGDFHLALCGGRTSQPLYERLMYAPSYRSLPWRRTHLWLVEERCVPFDNEASNYRVISETIADHSDIPPEQFHPIFVESEAAADDYEAAMRDTLVWREKGQDRLDFVLLSVGTDGGIAGLFPEGSVSPETTRLVERSIHPSPTEPDRITMTHRLINAARFVAIMASGECKAGMVRRLVRGVDTPDALPVKGVRPLSGELTWYLDADACQAMSES